MEYDDQLANKEEIIGALQKRLATLEALTHKPEPMGTHAVPGRSTSRGGSRAADPSLSHGYSRTGRTRRESSGGASIVHPPLVVEPIRPDHDGILTNVSGAEPSHRGSCLESASRTSDTRASYKASAGTTKYTPTEPQDRSHVLNPVSAPRRGKVPPVDAFSGEMTGVTFDDWYLSLQRAADWNQWTNEDTLIQLAGHLHGRALQEWTLLRDVEKLTLEDAVTALRGRLDPGSRALVAQDFRHAAQREGETVTDYISRLEQLFRRAYGREGMSDETRDTLLHSQLQEGLRYELMKAPAVSGSHTYRELCLAARNEEKRIAELAKRRQYRKPRWEYSEGPARERQRNEQDRYVQNLDRYLGGYSSDQGPVTGRSQPLGATMNQPRNQPPLSIQDQYQGTATNNSDSGGRDRDPGQGPRTGPAARGRSFRGQGPGARRCFNCNEVGHMMRDCPRGSADSQQSSTRPGVGQVVTAGLQSRRRDPETTLATTEDHPPPFYPLLSDSDEDLALEVQATTDGVSFAQHESLAKDSDVPGVRQVRIADRGSKPQYADVLVENVPARGVIDSGSDITIMGGELFRHLATVLRLRKSQFRKADKVPKTYDGRTFTLDGMIDLDITFKGVTMRTPVYIRGITPEQLLLGEGVCRQLQIVTYHPNVSDRRGKKWHPPPLPGQVDDKTAAPARREDQHSPPRTGGQKRLHDQEHSSSGERGPKTEQPCKGKGDPSDEQLVKRADIDVGVGRSLDKLLHP